MLILSFILTEKKGIKKQTAFEHYSDSIDAGVLLEKINSLVWKYCIGGYYRSLRIVVCRSAGADPCYKQRLFDVTFNFNTTKHGKIEENTFAFE